MKQAIWKTTRYNFISSCIIILAIFFITVTVGFYHKKIRLQKNIPLPAIITTSAQESGNFWNHITIHQGNSLLQIFKRQHISYHKLQNILKQPLAKKYLTKIKPGQQLYFHFDHQHNLIQLKFPFSQSSTLLINQKKNNYQSKLINKPMKIVLSYKSAIIHHTLAEAAQHAGLTHDLYSQLVTIFRNTINFSRNIRRGDHFSILYQEYYVNGKKFHPGKIVVAEFVNRGKIYQAIRFSYPKNHTGYYKPDGHSTEALLSLPPLKYNHISSYFTYHRLDPVLHLIRPHLGIDYAAPYGTPVKSIGNGKIILAGRDDGYGKAVMIRYSRKYKALFAHLEHFAKNIKTGNYVKKGQVIGYVGSSGWSTGPHLHFGLFVYGIPRNPLKLKFQSPIIPKSHLPQFFAQAKELLRQLNLFAGPEFAENQILRQHTHEE